MQTETKKDRSFASYTAAELFGFVQVWQSSNSAIEAQAQFCRWLAENQGIKGKDGLVHNIPEIPELSLKHIRDLAEHLRDKGCPLQYLYIRPLPKKPPMKLDFVKFVGAWMQAKTEKEVWELTGYGYGLMNAIKAYLGAIGIELPTLELGYTPYVNNHPKSLGATGHNPNFSWIKHGASPQDYAKKLRSGNYEDCHGQYKPDISERELLEVRRLLGRKMPSIQSITRIKKELSGG